MRGVVTSVSSSSCFYLCYYGDHIYTMTLIGIAITGPGVTISLYASGAGWQGGSDEASGIENVVVTGERASVSAVPLPAGLPLLASGLVLAAWAGRRRR